MHRGRNRSSVAACVTAILACGAVLAQGREATQFNLPAQPLSESLRAVGAQSSISIVFDASLVDGRVAPPLNASLSADEALERLLAGTGIHHRFLNERTIVLAIGTGQKPDDGHFRGGRAGTPTAAAGTGESESIRLAQLGQGAAEPAASPSEEPPLEEVVVKSSVVLTHGDAFGATKMGLSIKDTPQTVSIVTADLMQIASMKSFKDFYKVDASSGTTHSQDGYPNNFFRGYAQQGFDAIRLDGFRVPSFNELDLATLERFEVVKGATSSLYGQNSVGGMLNAVSKLPQPRFGASLAFEAGSFEDRNIEADVTGPLGSSETLSYRLIAVYRDRDSFIDTSSYGRTVVSPSIQWRPGDSTTVVLRGTYQKDDDHYAWAPALQFAGDGSGVDPSAADPMVARILAEGLQYIDVPRSRYYGMPWNGVKRESKVLHLQAEHEFANHWKLRASAQKNDIESTLNQFVTGGPLDEHGFAYFTSAYSSLSDASYYGGEVNLFGDFELFGRRHTLFLGADYIDTQVDQLWGGSSLSFGYADSLFNAYAPDYSAAAFRSFTDQDYLADNLSSQDVYGITAQLIVRPTDRLSVLLASRYSHSELGYGWRGGASLAELQTTSYSHEGFVFKDTVEQVGLTYEVSKALSVYATWGETFEPNTARAYSETDPAGILIPPEAGTAYEIGLKGELPGELSFAVALFDMERANISQRDLAHPNYSLALGTQTSRGIELSLQGHLLPSLNLSASVAWMDPEFASGEFDGLRPPNAPKFGLSAYGTYEILRGPLQGLGFGLGLVHKEGFVGFDANLTRRAGVPVTFDLGSFTELDARVFYQMGRWNLSLAATNLLNEKYYSQTMSNLASGINPNPPTAVRARVSVKF